MSSTEQAAAFTAMLAALDTTGTDAEHIDEITALEGLKSAISARQARVTDAFAVSQRARLIKAGTKTGDARRSVCAQIGLARRDSPGKGNRHVGLAATLVHEMPLLLRALERGEGSEWRVTLIARETAHLSREHRAQVDAAIADKLHGWSDAQTEREARGWAHRLDPTGAVDRARKAVTDRRVTIRPAPDCMTYLTALLPVKDGVGVYGVLHRAAMTAHCDPDDHRSKGQVMADELVRRTMTPGEGEPERAGIELHLVMTDRALADADDEPAHLVGHGPVPAALARDLITANDTTMVNGNGRCARCNLTKDLRGWATHVDDNGVITTTTPTGHAYRGRAPRPPTSQPWKAQPNGRRPRTAAAKPGLRIEIQWPADMTHNRQ